MKASVEYITPSVAEAMLQNNPNNRKLNLARVERMAAQMKRGAWQANGASIVMNGSMLLDGQHRLNAVAMSGMSFPFVVARDVSPSAFESIDTGSTRTLADVLHIQGKEHATVLAAAIRKYVTLKRGVAAESDRWLDLTHAEMIGVVEETPQIVNSVEFVRRLQAKPQVPAPTLAAIHCLCVEKDRDLADYYIRAITEGMGLKPGTVEGYVFARLTEISKSKRMYRMTTNERAWLVVRGWNMLRSGEPVKSFMRIGGKVGQGKAGQGKGKKAKFPTIE